MERRRRWYGTAGAKQGDGALVRLWLLVLLAASGACATTEAPPRAADLERAHAHLAVSRVGVIGASASAGFGIGVPLAIPLSTALRVPHEMIDGARSFFFMRPFEAGKEAIALMKEERASVVIAVDFLFWFAYGAKPLALRERHLESGLAMLDELDAELFVGDLPDMRGAAESMLPRAAIPPAEEFAPLNRIIEEWSAARPRVTLLPLAKWAADGRARAAAAGSDPAAPSAAPASLQWDRLHPTRYGLVTLAILCADALAARFPALAPEDLALDRERLVSALPAAGELPPPTFRGPLPLGAGQAVPAKAATANE
ncbi:MAG: hypothetical protein L0Z55_01555 [Planctomycetes bacterium]|nr:hypothetical protein [Planctomycetota bacterium]